MFDGLAHAPWPLGDMMHGGLGGIVGYSGSAATVSGGSLMVLADNLPPLYAGPTTAIGIVFVVCGLISTFFNVWARNEEGKRKLRLEEYKLAHDVEVRDLKAQIASLGRQTRRNTTAASANTAASAIMGGALDEWVKQLQEKGVLAVPEPSSDSHPADWPLILLVEDSPDTGRALGRLLAAHGFRIAHAGSISLALALLDQETPSLVLLDLMLPDGSGAEVLAAVRRKALPCRVVVTTASRDPEVLAKVEGLHPDALLRKPLDFEQLVRVLKQ